MQLIDTFFTAPLAIKIFLVLGSLFVLLFIVAFISVMIYNIFIRILMFRLKEKNSKIFKKMGGNLIAFFPKPSISSLQMMFSSAKKMTPGNIYSYLLILEKSKDKKIANLAIISRKLLKSFLILFLALIGIFLLMGLSFFFLILTLINSSNSF